MLKRPPAFQQLAIANQYLHGEIEVFNAARQLTAMGPFGKLLAGEVTLDAVTAGETCMTSTLSMSADKYYRGVISQTNSGEWRDGYDHAGSRIRAQMRLAQLTTVEALYGRRRMPERQSVEATYKRLSTLAHGSINRKYGEPSSKVDSAMEVRGTLGELAVLLLAQRFALREVGTDMWLPLQSSFREDNAGDCLNRQPGDYPWDLNVFTPSGQKGSLPNKTYTLQIKHYNDEKAGAPTGPTLYVNPDLALYPDERWVHETIIRHCAIEATNPTGMKRLTDDLDMRTEKFLNVLEDQNTHWASRRRHPEVSR